MAEEEASILDFLLKLVVVVAYIYMLVAIFARLLEDVLLYVVEQVLHVCLDTVDTYSFLFESVATHHLDSTVLKVTSSKHETHGHTLELVVGKLKSRALVL